ncbi:hypothetical protein DICPUDRAFT_74212 [Dictyostelium purpureum]|uniref:Uncharacterized protein n=1 Tax=Dictyostelium purpureum TaxID=5786 RepID=F0Z740_DICPU|nr:uncharacterized protein DICPUDRAFT_74212 [Dictyostelium purpureum]EGC40271.1 hypothetical protein DICPUDRAFT_74212 [Dictyostelium purpureum]|eukprot:XP_003283207.1 hypothetical protein DICPUDRAFT_74212 [Dictyostelium purpureum]
MKINTKLNSLIFNEILPYLSYKNSYRRILELSLISKQSFQIIQNLITHKHIINFDPKNLIRSIKKSKKNNNYELFLIRYKEMESFHNIWKSYSTKHLKKIKNKLLEQCEHLKKVIFNNVNVHFMEKNPTCDEFYEFKGVHLYWDKGEVPCSNTDELDLVEDEEDYYEFEFSFEFLSRYPGVKKISISTRARTHVDMDLNLEKLDGILRNCCTKVETIKFDQYHHTPHNFVEKVINSKSPAIKSFTARLGDHEDTSKLVAKLFRKSEISKNKILKVLKLRHCMDGGLSPLNEEPTEFLKTLIGNQTLESLGLELFIVSSSEKLSPLIQVPNITTLICSFDSFEAFLLHCNENHNITTLRVGWDTHYIQDFDDNMGEAKIFLVNALSNFFKNNKSSLRSIIFPKSSSEILEPINKEIFELINKERNNNNNNIKNIIFKFLDSYQKEKSIYL